MGLQPPLKWAGGKRWLVPILRPVWKQYKDYRLVEPFCGGLSIALGLLPDKALFIKDLKKEWDTIPERTRTKLLIMFYIEKKFMNNMLTDIIIMKIYYDYITS